MKPDQYNVSCLFRRIVQAKLFIDLHYAEHIDLQQIAGKAFFSKFHFIRLFKKAYGKTPHHYLTQVRIKNAMQLLTEGITVAEACFRVGFDSSTSFAALFKKYYGVSPSDYREKQLKKQASLLANPLYGVPNCFAETHGWKKSNIQ
jgi:AraC-like DNA-binding protein